MKKQIICSTLACVLSLALIGCTGSSHNTLLVADGEHQIEVGSGKNPSAYEIFPTSGIRLDIGHFHFTEGGATVTPDTVQIWDVAPTRYRLAQPIVTNVIVLDASTLTNVVSGGPPFAGFRSGHHLMVNVGRVLSPAQAPYEAPGAMTYDWVGLIIVK
jgi:hypothetical protein